MMTMNFFMDIKLPVETLDVVYEVQALSLSLIEHMKGCAKA